MKKTQFLYQKYVNSLLSATFYSVNAYFELVTISDDLDSDIQSLKTIIKKVNTKRKTRRDAKILADSYANGIIMWESTINNAIIDETKINEYVPLLKLYLVT